MVVEDETTKAMNFLRIIKSHNFLLALLFSFKLSEKKYVDWLEALTCLGALQLMKSARDD